MAGSIALVTLILTYTKLSLKVMSYNKTGKTAGRSMYGSSGLLLVILFMDILI
jgi:hypothetical protein